MATIGKIDVRRQGLCAGCQKENKPIPISEFFCASCKLELAEHIAEETEVIKFLIENERQQRSARRSEATNEYSKIDEMTPAAELGQGFNPTDRPTETPQPDPGTLDHFNLTTAEITETWLAFSNAGVKGFSFGRAANAQEAMALMVYMIGHTKAAYGHIPSDGLNRTARDVFNGFRASNGLDAIETRQYQKLKKTAELKIREYRKTGKINPKWIQAT